MHDGTAEEDPDADMIEEVVELSFELKKGSQGFGMEIADSGHVVSCVEGLPAAMAGVPMPSRIVSVNGQEVKNKSDIVAALKTAARKGAKARVGDAVVSFVMMSKRSVTKQEKAQEMLEQGEELFENRQYG
eukprot:COSAG05_NODE_12133_length_482_cov_0.804178_1_plen_130_part_10